MALNTFSSGVNTSFSTELNENFSALTVRNVTHTHAGPTAHTGDTNYATVTSFTLNHPANSILLGVSLEYTSDQLVGGPGSAVRCQMTITGSTLTTHYFGTKPSYGSSTDSSATWTPIVSTSNIDFEHFTSGVLAMGGAAFAGLILPDTSTTFTLQHKVDNSGDESELSNVVIKVIYVDVGVQE